MITTQQRESADLATKIRQQQPSPGLVYRMARNYNEVLRAWSLVCQTYYAHGLIESSTKWLAAMEYASLGNAGVLLGYQDDALECTLTFYADRAGLALESSYAEEITALRDAGRSLCEVGLMGDVSRGSLNSRQALMQFMSYPIDFALRSGFDDIVIGVHPRHMPFYRRIYGFEQAGPIKRYAMVNDRPVVLLRLDLAAAQMAAHPPHGLRYVMQNPQRHSFFADRFDFKRATVRRPSIQISAA